MTVNDRAQKNKVDVEIGRDALTRLLMADIGDGNDFPVFPALLYTPPVDLGDAFRAPLRTSVPTLFISGTLDSNSPPFQAGEVRWGFTRGTHLILENAGLEDTLPDKRVQQAIMDFFAGKDVGERHIALSPPDFLSVEEAKKDRKID